MPKTRMFLRNIKSVGFVDYGACGGDVGQGGADIVLCKRRDATPTEEKSKMSDPVQDVTAPEATAAGPTLEAVTAERDGLLTRVAELEQAAAKTAEKPAEPDDVLKNADPAVIAIVEKARKESEAATKRADEAMKAAAIEREKREQREWVEKARAYKALPVKEDDLGEVLRKAHSALDDTEFETLSKVLSAGSEAIAKGFQELGRSGGADPGSAASEIAKRAKTLIDEGKATTIEQARVAVRNADRELADREREERSAA